MYTDRIHDFKHNDKEYQVWKKIETTPQRISYGIFDSNDALVFRCELAFIGDLKFKDVNFYTLYDDLDFIIATGLEKQFTLNTTNAVTLKDLKLQNRLAKFDAKVEKERLKKEKGKKD